MKFKLVVFAIIGGVLTTAQAIPPAGVTRNQLLWKSSDFLDKMKEDAVIEMSIEETLDKDAVGSEVWERCTGDSRSGMILKVKVTTEKKIDKVLLFGFGQKSDYQASLCSEETDNSLF